MTTSPFPVQRSLLSALALAERVLPKYDLPGRPTCQFWSRSINDTYLVKAGEARWTLRVSPTNWRTYEHLETEIALLQFLHRYNITTPQPVSQQDGTYIHTLKAPEGPRYAVLFTFVHGAPPRPMTEAYSYAYGQAIARLHLVTDKFPAGRPCFCFDPSGLVDEPLARLKPLFADHQADLNYLLEIAPRLKEAASQLPRTAPVFGLCHGDVNNSNIHFNDQGNWALLDFEYIGYGWRVLDIGNFFNNHLYNLDRAERTQTVRDAFLDGYQSVRPLSKVELDTLPAFVLLRQIWILGVAARNLPNITNVDRETIQHWMFDQCMGFVRSWVKKVW